VISVEEPDRVAPRLSLIIPVLSDAAAARLALTDLGPDPDREVIVVDGGSDPQLDALALQAGARLIRSAPGRGRQMNAGAEVATGEWLLFLHADSRLPPGWRDAFEHATRSGIVGGWFRFAIDDRAWQARAIERGVALRVRWLGLPYGDQGLFVHRATFKAIGGYRDWPLMEDVEFARAMMRAGSVAELPLPLATSARRWRRDGWFRRSARNVALVLLYFAGVSPERLARWYP
jgi:rSAM/selenodomain-associated transferase 2